jgi:hypothetical protein
MARHGERLGKKAEQFLIALLEKPTIKAAAHAVGVAERTAHNWLAKPEFAKRFREERRRLVEHATARLQKAMHLSVTALLRILKHGTESNQLAAAKAILEYGGKGIQEDVLARLDALEAKLLPGHVPSTNGVHGANGVNGFKR